MKRLFLMSALTLTMVTSLVLSIGSTNGSVPKGNKNTNGPIKMSPRAEALKKCNDAYKDAVKRANDDYVAAVKDAKGKKGKERAETLKAANKAKSDAWAAAKKAKADCSTAAPKK